MIPSTETVDPPGTLTRPRWHLAAVVLILVALVMGDDGPWIVVVPGLVAVCGPWLDRRISFSFAEGFIGYCLDPEPARDPTDEDEPPVWQRSIPAAS